MKKLLLTVIILLHFTSCDAQKSNLENDFYVINVLGAELYEKPSLNSKVLLKIKVGEKLIAKEIIKTEQSKIIVRFSSACWCTPAGRSTGAC